MQSGFYEKMLADGVIKKEEDLEPELGPLYFYMEAFEEIGTARPVGMGVGPIPFTAVAEYCRLFEIQDFEEFHSVIRHLDRVFMELSAESSDKEKPREGKKKSGGNSGSKDHH